MTEATGQCLCGAVRFALKEALPQVGLCHCKMCRRWSGGLPLAAVSGEVKLLADQALRWHQSSGWGERGFCCECGTPLFWRAGGAPLWAISAGALNDDEGLIIARHIFIDDKAGFYELADKAPQHTGAEWVAQTLAVLEKQFGSDFLTDALAKVREHNGDAFADEIEQLLARR